MPKMQPSSKEVVLLQEKKGEKNFNFNPQKVPLSTRAQKKKYIQGRKAEQFFISTTRSAFTFCSSSSPPLIFPAKLTSEKLSDLHRSSHNQLVHK